MSQSAISNPFAGSVLADSWWLKRRSPGGRVSHFIDPQSLIAVCGAAPKHWEVVPEGRSFGICQKCSTVSKRLRWEL